jgi:hypothetical protein
MLPADLNVIYRLKPFIQIQPGKGPLILKGPDVIFRIEDCSFIDLDKLESEHLIVQSSDENIPFFLMWVRTLLSEDFLTLECDTGLILDNISWESIKDMNRLSPLANNFSAGTVIEAIGVHIRIIHGRTGFIARLTQQKMFDALNGIDNKLQLQLTNLGFLSNDDHLKLEEPLSLAFHNITTRSLYPVNPECPRLELPWSGELVPGKIPSDQVLSLFRGRRSARWVDSGPYRLPTMDEIISLLATTFGPYTKEGSPGRIFFHYPSAGGGYTVTVKVILPENSEISLYDYNPLQNALVKSDTCDNSIGPNYLVKIILTAEFERIKLRYSEIPYRLLLLDSGVLLHQLSLATTYHGLHGRIQGYTNEKKLKKKFPYGFKLQELVLGEYQLTGSQEINSNQSGSCI